jgi:hypothetical protein
LYGRAAAACENPFQFWTVMDIFKGISFVCLVSLLLLFFFLHLCGELLYILLQLSLRTLPVDIRGFLGTKRAAAVTN